MVLTVILSLKYLDELTTLYNVHHAKQLNTYERKTPSDVYDEIHKAMTLIQSLGVAEISPSNVYIIASGILNDSKKIAKRLGKEIEVQNFNCENKKPIDIAA